MPPRLGFFNAYELELELSVFKQPDASGELDFNVHLGERNPFSRMFRHTDRLRPMRRNRLVRSDLLSRELCVHLLERILYVGSKYTSH